MTTPFTATRTDNSFTAILDRVITGALTLALVGTVGAMPMLNFLTLAWSLFAESCAFPPSARLNLRSAPALLPGWRDPSSSLLFSPPHLIVLPHVLRLRRSKRYSLY